MVPQRALLDCRGLSQELLLLGIWLQSLLCLVGAEGAWLRCTVGRACPGCSGAGLILPRVLRENS